MPSGKPPRWEIHLILPSHMGKLHYYYHAMGTGCRRYQSAKADRRKSPDQTHAKHTTYAG
ncbi:MAG: hypothetical protein WCP91_01555 [Candidatus Berkelbacteria bacterium]